MNGKIPVFGAAWAAYAFLFGQFLTIIRLSWVWMVAIGVVSVMWGPGIEAAMREFQASKNAEALMPHIGQIFGMAALQLLGFTVVMVALLRAAISGDNRPGVPLHLISGMPDVRLIAASVLLFIAFLSAGIAFAFVVGLVEKIAGPAGAGLLGLVAGAVLIYVGLGLSLLAPVASVEANLGVERSWQLMEGNRLRMFVATVLTMLPVGALLALAFAAVIVPSVGVMPDVSALPPEGQRVALQAYQDKVAAFLRQDYTVFTAGSLVLSLIVLGLQAGLSGKAYRAATGMDG